MADPLGGDFFDSHCRPYYTEFRL